MTRRIQSLSRFCLGACLAISISSISVAQEIASEATSGEPRNNNWPEYVVGLETAFPPFALRDTDGSVIGFDIDVLDAIAEVEQFNVVYIPQLWTNEIFYKLDDLSRDIIMSGTRHTPERLVKWQATDVMLESQDSFLVKRSSGISSIDDLKYKTVAVAGDSAQYENLVNLYQNQIGEIVTYPTSALAYAAMVRDEVNAVFTDSGILNYYVANTPKELRSGRFELVTPANAKATRYSFFIKRDREDLLEKLNRGLSAIEQNGRLQEIKLKWFGE